MPISEPVYLHYLSSLLEGDKSACQSIVKNLLQEKVCVKSIYEDIIKKSMYRIGQLWDKCRLSVAEEHMATEITKEILSLINQNTSGLRSSDKTVIITCVQKEQHEIGPKLISDFFEFKGWNSLYVGANISPNEFLSLIAEKNPQLVGISNNFYLNVTKLFELIDLIKKDRPQQKIIVGGQGPKNCQIEVISKYPEVEYLNSLDDLENYLAQLDNH